MWKSDVGVMFGRMNLMMCSICVCLCCVCCDDCCVLFVLVMLDCIG